MSIEVQEYRSRVRNDGNDQSLYTPLFLASPPFFLFLLSFPLLTKRREESPLFCSSLSLFSKFAFLRFSAFIFHFHEIFLCFQHLGPQTRLSKMYGIASRPAKTTVHAGFLNPIHCTNRARRHEMCTDLSLLRVCATYSLVTLIETRLRG